MDEQTTVLRGRANDGDLMAALQLFVHSQRHGQEDESWQRRKCFRAW